MFDVNGVLTIAGGANAATSGNLTKTGLGTAVIAGTTNLGTGSVTVSAGTLRAGFGTGGTSAINVAASAMLSMQNSAIEALVLNNTAGNLVLGAGSAFGFELNGATNDSISTGAGVGTASVSAGTITLNFFNTGAGVVPGTYNLLSSTAGGLLPIGVSYAIGATPNPGFNYSITQTDTLVSLGVVLFQPLYWTNSQTGGSWATSNAGPLTNFSTDQAGGTNATITPGALNTVIFSADSAAGATVNTALDGNYTIYSLQFKNNGNATPVTAVNIAAGSPSTSTLTIAPSSSTGGIDVGASAGAVTISADVVASSAGAPNQTWAVDGTGANGSSLVVSGKTTFTANVIKTGAGALTVSGAMNSGTGGFTLTGGTLNANSNGALGTGTFTINAGTTLDNTSAGSLTLTGGSNIWNGDFTYTGATQSLNLGTGAVTMGANIQATVSGNTLTAAGGITDGASTFSLTKAGAGTLVLNGNNTYDGTTTVSAGTLTLGGNNSGAGGVTLAAGAFLNLNSDGALGMGTLTLSGGTIDSPIAARGTTNNNLQTWTNGATVVFTGTNTLNLGTGAVTLGTDATAGTFTLTNNATVGAPALIVGGAISAVAGGTAGAKTLTIAGTGNTSLTGNITKGSAASITITDTLPGTATLTLSGAASNILLLSMNASSGTSIVDVGTGNLTFNAAGQNSLQSTTGGTIKATGGGTLTLGGISDNWGTANGTTLTINAKITGIAANTFEAFAVASGTGVMVLANNTNDFAGNVALNSGVLSVASINDVGVASGLGAGNGTGVINLGNGTGTGTALNYTGGGGNTNRVLNLSATTGAAIIDLTGSTTTSGSPLKFTTNATATGVGIKTLTLTGPASTFGEFSGTIVNNSATNLTSISKTGAGTWTFSGLSGTAANNYTGTTTIDDGTLAMSATSPTLTGGLTFGNAAGNTTASNLDISNVLSGATFTGAALVRTKTAINTIFLGTKTLTFNGGLTLGYDAGSGTGANASNLTVTGAGTMAVNGTAINISVNQAVTNAAYFSTAALNVTALASFNTNVTTFNIGVGSNTTGNGAVLLSNTANTILATTLVVGDTGGNNGNGVSTLTLGTGTNVIQADTIRIGRGKAGGNNLIGFVSQAPASPGTVTIANKAGTGQAVIEVGNVNTVATVGGAGGVLDLRGHVATVDASTLLIGQANAASNVASGIGTVSFDAGTFTVGTLNMGLKTGASTGPATGTLNVGGGAFTVNTAFTLGSQASGGTSVATVNLTGGTFTSNVAILKVGTTPTSTINLDGSTAILNLANNAIGSATNLITLNAKQGTLQNLSQLNGGGTLTKTTAGTLTLSGTNNYTGATNINQGTVNIDTVAAGATTQSLGLNTTANAVTLGVALASSGTLNYTGAAGTLGKSITALGNGLDTIRNSSVTGALTLSGTITKNGTTLTLDGGTQGINVTGTVVGASAGSDLNVQGSVNLGAGNHSYNGPTTVNAASTLTVAGSLSGTTAVLLNPGGLLKTNGGSNNIGSGNATPNAGTQTFTGTPSGATFTSNGGTLAIAQGAGGDGTTHTFTSMTLNGSAILDFSSGAGTTNTNVNLLFTSLTLGGTLTIDNWSGSAYAAGATADIGTFGDGQDRLIFTSDPGFTIGTAIAGINFTGFGSGMAVNFGAGQFEIVPVPEPATATLLGFVALCALIGYRARRRTDRAGTASR